MQHPASALLVNHRLSLFAKNQPSLGAVCKATVGGASPTGPVTWSRPLCRINHSLSFCDKLWLTHNVESPKGWRLVNHRLAVVSRVATAIVHLVNHRLSLFAENQPSRGAVRKATVLEH